MATNKTLEQLANGLAPEIRKAFLASVQGIKSKAQLAQLVRMLENGDVEGALKAVGIDVLKFRPLEDAIVSVYGKGGEYQASRVPGVRQPDGYVLKIGFNIQNPRAEQWLYSHSGTLIQQITDDQRNLVRDALRAGMEAGQNPRDVALSIAGRINAATGRREGGLIGLTAKQAEWVRAYELDLQNLSPNALQRELRDRRFDRTVRAAIRDGRPLTRDEIAPMVRNYENRALRYRAVALARTEAMTSLSTSSMEAMQQAIDEGQVTAAHVLRVWHSARDKRVRDTHLALDGTSIRFNDVGFLSPSGAMIRYPGDPQAPAAERINCRCYLELKVDFLASIAPPLAPQPKLKPDTKQLDAAARNQVLSEGRSSGVEHISAYNRKTGEVVENPSQGASKSHVGFSFSFTKAISDANNEIIAHHNHPGSTSLSPQDLKVLAQYPGLHTLFAHGHDGSQYSAEALKPFSGSALKSFATQVRKEILAAIKGNEISPDDASQIYGHLVNTLYARAGYISYDAVLAGGTSDAMTRADALVRAILGEAV